jgi:transketolase
MRDAFVRRLVELAEADPRIFLITGDLGFGVLTDFAKRFRKQFLNVGVAEQNMIGVATGLALEGRIVFVYSIANFPTLRCLEQIRNDACYHDANVKIVAVGGGFSYGSLGISHHATEDIAIMRALPGMTVVVPGDEWEATEATSAVAARPGTCYLRLDKSKAEATHQEGDRFQLGGIRTARQGKDVALICSGGILGVGLRSADILATKGVECGVLSVHTVKPLDREVLFQAARSSGAIVTLEEHTVEGGLGGAVAEVLLEAGTVPRRFLRLGLANEFSSVVGSQDFLRMHYGLDETTVADRVLELIRN